MKSALLAGMLVLASASAAFADGESLFNDNCAVCHQPGGAGVPGQFPRLAWRAGAIAAKPAGRDYLMQVVLNGMAGTVTIDKQTITGGVMPDFAALPDADLAAILTYVASLKSGAAVPFGAGDLKAARAKPVGNTAMLRKTLVAAKVVP